MQFLFIILTLLIFILIYKQITAPSTKDILEYKERQENKRLQDLDFKEIELIFEQFNKYVFNLFKDNNGINKKSLLDRLSKDFPYYKEGNYDELFFDLLSARLIKHDNSTDVYTLGQSYSNLLLKLPLLINFLKSQCCNNEEFVLDNKNSYRVESTSIHKNIGSLNIYFYFGACKGRELLKKLGVGDPNISSNLLYLYTYTYIYLNNSYSEKDRKLLHYEYRSLEDDLSMRTYEDMLDSWETVSTRVINDFLSNHD